MDLHEIAVWVRVKAGRCGDFQRFPRKCVHRNLSHRNGCGVFNSKGGHLPRRRCFRGARAGPRPSSTVPVAWHPGVWRRGGLKKFPPQLKPDLFVPFNVNVYSQYSYSLGHDEGQGPEIKRPAVVVVVLFVLVFLVAGVPCIAGDVDDDANYVAEPYKRYRTLLHSYNSKSI